ncbi:MAG: type IX secretion system sortase PorU [Bacteroidales bacterium]|nr:type IX secretion system sortase PorU [Bacteroidales bacterium]
MRYFLLILFPLFILSNSYAQQTSYKRSIVDFSLKKTEEVFIEVETENTPPFLLHFDNCTYSEDSGFLPVYHELLPLPGESSELNIKVSKLQKLDPAIIKLLKLDKNIQSTLSYSTTIQTVRKNKFSELELLPFIRDSLTGSISLIVEFEITFTEKLESKPIQLKSARRGISENSVLSTGKWAKLKIIENGIYQIGYDELVGLGFDPSNPRIFGNGGKTIPFLNSQQTQLELVENTIWIEKGSDNVFNTGDYLLFYAEGPVTWDYDETSGMFLHSLHLYDEASYYFLTSGGEASKIIEDDISPLLPPDKEIHEYNQYFYHELENENLIHSGRQWFEPISGFSATQIGFPGQNLAIGRSAKIKIKTAARSPIQSGFEISQNGSMVGSFTIQAVNMSSYTSDYAKTDGLITDYTPSGNGLNISIRVANGNTQNALFWLDFIDLNVRKDLVFEGPQMQFRDLESVNPGSISEFHVKNAPNNGLVWDVTDIYNIKKILLNVEGNNVSFIAETDSLRQFIIADPAGFKRPEIIEENLPNQNLVSLEDIDLLIVSPTEFLEEANRLASFHISNDQLSVAVVSTIEVYNEFSSGARDAGAIRNYMKILYDKASTGRLPKYLLLFGDGSFDNKSNHENNTNKIPTYQSENSLIFTQSYVTDDFYGLLDEFEGGAAGLVDVGIGRIPINTVEEAVEMVDKIITYNAEDAFGEWRNKICFVADDEDNNIHMRDADILSNYVESEYGAFNIHKIFLDSYVQETTPSGESYPDVNAFINEDIRNGILIFNYTGHGNERGLAHENILGINDIQSWTNKNKLPLFVTATCEFSRFDDIDRDIYGDINRITSAGELVLLSSEGGGIGLLTTTRLVYSSPNFVLNRNFYKHIFENDADGNRLRLGDVLRMTKNESGSGINKRNFTLLGDPALSLTYPEQFIITDSINGQAAGEFTDTLKALGQYSASGYIADLSGNALSSLSGVVEPIIFDKKSTVKTLSNDGTPVMEFEVRDKVLYKGKSTVKNGRFNTTFTIPKDISFKTGNGKISYYFKADEEEIDAHGYYEDIIVGGYSDSASLDTSGPEIRLFLNDTLFISGGIADANPSIFALIYDESGINTLGNGIGHDMVAVLDGNSNSPIILNNYYKSDLDSYQSGSVLYPMSQLSEGMHTLSLKAWDIYNNSSSASIEFKVLLNPEPVVTNLISYPNPFTDGTSFSMEHNMPDSELDIAIYIYNLTGKIIKTIKERYYSAGYHIGPIEWDGKNDNGGYVDSGIYFYQIQIKAPDETISVISSKMVKIR